jgi:hypothetical protein
MKRTSHSYFVVMMDFGRRGLEAIVRPEDTRRDIVEMLASGEKQNVVFIHHVDGLYVEDVTKELIDEAGALVDRDRLVDWFDGVAA